MKQVEVEVAYQRELSQCTAALEAERVRAQGLAADLTAECAKHAVSSQYPSNPIHLVQEDARI